MLLRDSDCGLERFLGERGTGGMALQQDFAAKAMHGRETVALVDLIGQSQRLVDARERTCRPQRLRLELRQKRVEERRGKHLALIRERRQRLPKFCGGRPRDRGDGPAPKP